MATKVTLRSAELRTRDGRPLAGAVVWPTFRERDFLAAAIANVADRDAHFFRRFSRQRYNAMAIAAGAF